MEPGVGSGGHTKKKGKKHLSLSSLGFSYLYFILFFSFVYVF
jgi:hypothetical protein